MTLYKRFGDGSAEWRYWFDERFRLSQRLQGGVEAEIRQNNHRTESPIQDGGLGEAYGSKNLALAETKQEQSQAAMLERVIVKRRPLRTQLDRQDELLQISFASHRPESPHFPFWIPGSFQAGKFSTRRTRPTSCAEFTAFQSRSPASPKP